MKKICRIALLTAVAGALFLSCGIGKPIKVGFSACLTGLKSDLGVNAMYAVQLALDQVNREGGIRGRKLELVIRDDKADPDVALACDQELAKEGVVAIIGHMESGTIVKSLPWATEHGLLYISPTISGQGYAGIDDALLRVVTSGGVQSKALAGIMAKDGRKRTAVLWDSTNQAYATSLKEVFVAEARPRGNSVVFDESFNLEGEKDYGGLAQRIKESTADALLLFASSTETANLLQNLSKYPLNIPTYMAGWSMSSDLLTRAGSSAEGTFLVNNALVQSDRPQFVRFARDYRERYGSEPTAGAILAHDAFTVLTETLRHVKSRSPADIKAYILDNPEFEGLQSRIVFDRYGDVARPTYLFTVRNGTYVLLGDED